MKDGVCICVVGNTIICAQPFVLSPAEPYERIEKAVMALDRLQKVLSN